VQENGLGFFVREEAQQFAIYVHYFFAGGERRKETS
jgi:hypothetical protein